DAGDAAAVLYQHQTVIVRGSSERSREPGALLRPGAGAILGSLMGYSAIGADEIVVARPFTDPEFTRREAEVMRVMLTREREHAQAWRGDHGRPAGGQIVRDQDGKERRHLLVVPDTRALIETRGLTAVGFF